MIKKTAFAISFVLIHLIAFSQGNSHLHKSSVLVDTHNDVLTELTIEGKDISHRLKVGHSDLDRWKEGGVDIQFFSIWTGEKARTKEGFYKDANQEIDSLELLVLRNYTRMTLATTYKQVRKSVKRGKFTALIGVEGGHMIEDDLAKLKALSDRGMRYMTLTWNNSTSWASSAMDETLNPDSLKHKGLNDFGKQVVRRMNELGVIVDLSHTGEQTFYDALSVTNKPVILSHSSVWNLCPVFRNVKDDQIRAVAKNKGVICINFYSGFVSAKYEKRQNEMATLRKAFQDSVFAIARDSVQMRNQWREYFRGEMKKVQPSISDLVDHIDYIVKLVGDDYVGIGSDYDGISSLPEGLEDVTTYPKITDELVSRGYKEKSIRKILGGNVLRVMKANFR